MPSWKQITDWPKYEVSDDGEIRRNGKIIRCRPASNGYMRVTLSDEPNGRRSTISVHRAVAIEFHGPPPTERHQVDHLNGIKQDNRASNLAWVTPRQNRKRHQIAMGSKNGTSVLTETDVIELRAAYDNSSESVSELAHRFGVSRQTVTKIGRRHAWTHI